MTENSFSQEFLPYNDNLIKVIDKTIQKGRDENKDTLYFLRGYYIFVNFLVDEKNVFNDMPDGFKVLLSKASLDLFAIYNTISSGCMSQSLTLVRSLFESSVYLTYINRDFEKLLEFYQNYKDFLAYHKWNQEKELFDLPKETEEEIVQKYESIKNNYSKRGPWYERPLLKDMEEHIAFNHMKKKRATFRAMCVITGNEEFYNRLYSTMSESVHGSSLIGSLFINEKDNISMAPNFSPFYIDTTAAFAILFLHNMVSIGLNNQIEKGHSEYLSYLRYSVAYADQLIDKGIKYKY
ncbi:DUF5677 domain-containing protein [Peribacillus simplex]|uniref:DUF5677 domain-containing protein n=1 Tax=Peribacillus simplex TaxID=1478 RepID=UPI0028532011|nr:DUF5677 domain-containing protein [Peribacillus simplex]MDR4927239.1 DUF5677 domain-containing protein [Peribacillus simplex]